MDILSFLEEANALKVAPKPWMTTGNVKLIRVTAEMLPAVIDECIAAGLYGLDLETTGLDSRVFNGETVCKIVGCCLAPSDNVGYYIPLRHKVGTEHNVPWTLWKREMNRLIASAARAVFHNGIFDQEFLEFCGGEPVGEWDDPKKWEDTLILAYLRDTRAKQKGLKFLSKTELDMEMIELEELFPAEKRKNGLDFSELDPSWEPVTWYGASDAVCTRRLYARLAPKVMEPYMDIQGQGLVYMIEKMCVTSTRWMQRARILTDQDKAKELIRIGQREWFAALEEVYKEASAIVDRDISPGYYKLLRGDVPGMESFKFDPEAVQPGYMERVDAARSEATKKGLDPTFKDDKKKIRIKTIAKRVPSIANKGTTEEVQFPEVYDILVPEVLGLLLRECKVPGLTVTEKSGQVATNKEEIERILEEVGDKYPFAGKIKKFRDVSKALGTYLLPIIEDCAPDHTLAARFNAFTIDTGRFNAPSSKHPEVDGGTRFPFHGTPATYDPKRPECLSRIRECIISRPGKFIVAIDFSGVELRIATNLSLEPKWLREFFHCASCDRMFPGSDGTCTPMPPPPFCPDCGSDKIGDLHTLTGISIYGDDAPKRPEWKALRGYAKCVHPDSLVGVNQMIAPLGSMVPDGPRDTFSPAGDASVWNGSRFVPLLEFYRGEVKDLYHVVTSKGILTCTDAHGFLTADGSLLSIRDGLAEGTLLTPPEAGPHLDNRDYPILPLRTHEDLPEVGFQPTDATAYMAGLFLGDGTSNVSNLAITHGSVDKVDVFGVPYYEWQTVIMDACGDCGLRPVRRPKSVYLGSRVLRRFFESLGLIQGTRRRLRVPTWVMHSGPMAMLHFLGGLADTDGCVARDGSLSVLSKDAVFLGQVTALFQALGFAVTVEPSWNKTYERYYFRVRVPASSAHRMTPYMRHPGKLQRLREVAPGRALKDTNKVLKILPAGRGPTVDLHVGTDDHLYWVNGLVTHNSTNFALVYGGGGNAVVLALKGEIDKSEGWRIKELFDKTYRVLSAWWTEQHKFAKKYKFVVTAFGRRYPVPDIDSELGGFRSKAERNAVNGPVQATSADITKLAMGLIHKECKKRGWLEKVHMLITMHDELVFEIDKDILEEACDTFVQIMCRNAALLHLKWPVPLTSDVEIGLNWMVPWDLKKIRHKKEVPPELEGCFKGIGIKVKEAEPPPPPPGWKDPRAKATRVYKLPGFTLGEVDKLAHMLTVAPTNPTLLRVEGPNGEDLTSMLMVAWGGVLPDVEGV